MADTQQATLAGRGPWHLLPVAQQPVHPPNHKPTAVQVKMQQNVGVGGTAIGVAAGVLCGALAMAIKLNKRKPGARGKAARGKGQATGTPTRISTTTETQKPRSLVPESPKSPMISASYFPGDAQEWTPLSRQMSPLSQVMERATVPEQAEADDEHDEASNPCAGSLDCAARSSRSIAEMLKHQDFEEVSSEEVEIASPRSIAESDLDSPRTGHLMPGPSDSSPRLPEENDTVRLEDLYGSVDAPLLTESPTVSPRGKSACSPMSKRRNQRDGVAKLDFGSPEAADGTASCTLLTEPAVDATADLGGFFSKIAGRSDEPIRVSLSLSGLRSSGQYAPREIPSFAVDMSMSASVSASAAYGSLDEKTSSKMESDVAARLALASYAVPSPLLCSVEFEANTGDDPDLDLAPGPPFNPEKFPSTRSSADRELTAPQHLSLAGLGLSAALPADPPTLAAQGGTAGLLFPVLRAWHSSGLPNSFPGAQNLPAQPKQCSITRHAVSRCDAGTSSFSPAPTLRETFQLLEHQMYEKAELPSPLSLLEQAAHPSIQQGSSLPQAVVTSTSPGQALKPCSSPRPHQLATTSSAPRAQRRVAPKCGVVRMLYDLVGQGEARHGRSPQLPGQGSRTTAFVLPDVVLNAIQAESNLRPLLQLLDGVGTEKGISEPLALKAAAKLPIDNKVKEQMASASVLGVLAMVIRSGNEEEQEAAAGAVSNMATTDELRQAVWDSGCCSELVELLADPEATPRAREVAAGAITNLSCSSNLRTAMVHAGALDPLANLISQRGTGVLAGPLEAARASACRALANLACDPSTGAAVSDHPRLVKSIVRLILASVCTSSSTRTAAAMAACNLSFSPKTWDQLVDAGAVEGSTEILLESGRSGGCGPEALAAASVLLWNLSSHPLAQEAMAGSACTGLLLRVLSDPQADRSVRKTAAGAIGKLSLMDEGATAVEVEDGIEVVAAVMRETANTAHSSQLEQEPLLREASRVLIALSADDDHASEFVAEGCVLPLCRLLCHSVQPESKEVAARAIWLLAASRHDAVAAAVEFGAVTELAQMLHYPWEGARIAAAHALANLALCPAGREAAAKACVPALLVPMLQEAVKHEAALSGVVAVTNLCHEQSNCRAIARASGVPVIVGLLSHEAMNVRAAACQAMVNLATSVGRREQIVSSGGIAALVAILSEEDSPSCWLGACNALSNLMWLESLRPAVAQAGAVPPLCKILRSPAESIGRAAAISLHYLATLPESLEQMLRVFEAEESATQAERRRQQHEEQQRNLEQQLHQLQKQQRMVQQQLSHLQSAPGPTASLHDLEVVQEGTELGGPAPCLPAPASAQPTASTPQPTPRQQQECDLPTTQPQAAVRWPPAAPVTPRRTPRLAEQQDKPRRIPSLNLKRMISKARLGKKCRSKASDPSLELSSSQHSSRDSSVKGSNSNGPVATRLTPTPTAGVTPRVAGASSAPSLKPKAARAAKATPRGTINQLVQLQQPATAEKLVRDMSLREATGPKKEPHLRLSEPRQAQNRRPRHQTAQPCDSMPALSPHVRP